MKKNNLIQSDRLFL